MPACTNRFFCCAQRLTETRTNTLRAASTYRPAVLTDPMTSFSSPPPTSSSALLSSYHLQVCLTARVFNTPSALLPSHRTSHLHSFPYFPKSRVSSDSKGLVLCLISPTQKDKHTKKKINVFPHLYR